MRGMLLAVGVSVAWAFAAPALAGPADCLWNALPSEKAALTGWDSLSTKGWNVWAAGRLPPEALSEAAFRCGSRNSMMDGMAEMMVQGRAARLDAERSLARYPPAELAAALDEDLIASALEDGLGMPEDKAVLVGHFRTFVGRLKRPPNEAEREELEAYFTTTLFEAVGERLWALSADNEPSVEVEVSDADLLRDAALAASQLRPAWETGDGSACAWKALSRRLERFLYAYPLIASAALMELPRFEVIQALRRCSVIPDKAAIDDLGHYMAVRAGERGLIGRFESTQLEAAFTALGPMDQVEQLEPPYGLIKVSPGLERFRSNLGLKPETDLNHGRPEDDAVNAYFMARAMLAHHRRR